MALYEAKMQHDESSFEALAHMQYNIFCVKNRVARTILSGVLILTGVLNFSEWWGILITAYGCYLTTSTYSSANYTAHKLAKQITDSGASFPSTRYLFQEKHVEIFSPADSDDSDKLKYSDIKRIAEDSANFYLFLNEVGGYMVPKEQFGEKISKFRSFLEGKTGQRIYSRSAPIIKFFRRRAK